MHAKTHLYHQKGDDGKRKAIVSIRENFITTYITLHWVSKNYYIYIESVDQIRLHIKGSCLLLQSLTEQKKRKGEAKVKYGEI